MDAKLRLCLLLIILGTITVQGARPKNEFENVVRSPNHGECAFTLRKTIYEFSFNKPFESNGHTVRMDHCS